jgi:hypothetical protein
MFTVYHAHGEMPFPTKQMAWAYAKQLAREGITDLCIHYSSNTEDVDECVFGTWKFHCDDKVYFCSDINEVFQLDNDAMPTCCKLEMWDWKSNTWVDVDIY